MNAKNLKITVLIIIAVIAIASAGGYLYLRDRKSVSAPSAAAPLETVTQIGQSVASSVSQGVLPSLGGAANPLKNQPDLNPVNNANPFNAVKTNPFKQ